MKGINLMNLSELKEKRFRFVNYLYKISEGNPSLGFNMSKIGEALELSPKETGNICQYLNNEQLIRFIAQGGTISITHKGIIEVENALSKPKENTKYFPPAINIIEVKQMIGSQIQQSVLNSKQFNKVAIDSNINILKFIETLKSSLPELPLSDDDKSEMQADITTIETQLSSSRPKYHIVYQSLESIKDILEGIAGSIIAQELLKYFPALLDLFK